ncbi:phage tail domain-containing protein [Listeria booriae]|uniref:phage tail domain-containing protein n=1 Tax=Listeria booriae TaxID=1552123 RepID=UPI0016236C3C|nr:phage tail domain-containing protein [Listeria booriae]MBC2106153.1 phage tail protein [Listeria booriae]
MHTDILIDGYDCTEYDICPVERPTIPTAKRDINIENARGRNGSIIDKFGYEDIKISITFNFLERCKSFKVAFRHLKPWLLYAEKLAFADDLGFYYRVKHVEIDDAENEILEHGEFKVEFILDPFQYLVTSDIAVKKNQELYNLGTIYSEPYIKIVGSGDIKLVVNQLTVTLKGVSGFIELDSELYNAFKNDGGIITDQNTKMFTYDFPILDVGKNVIDWTGNVQQVILNARWRCL